MGISPFNVSSSRFDDSGFLGRISYSSLEKKKVINNPNPNPLNYKILFHAEENNYLLVIIQYLDCTNYEGKKILLFKDCKLNDLLKQKCIDPHFCDNKKYHSPIARFVPNEFGFDMAVSIMKKPS